MQKTSIIIPCLLTSPELSWLTKNAINSIRKTTKDYEIIIVDDNSPLGSEFLKREADIYIRNKKRLGFGKSVNKGWKRATGHYIVTANNDIEVYDDWQEIMTKWMDLKGVGGSCLWHEKKKKLNSGKWIWQEKGREIIINGMYFFHGGFWMTTRDIIKRIGYLDERFEIGAWEDVDWFYRCMKAGYKLITSFEQLMYHQEGATRRETDEKTQEDKRITERNHRRFILKWGFDPLEKWEFPDKRIKLDEFEGQPLENVIM